MRKGQVLGERYRLEEPIGQGGMSVVWQGTDFVLGRQVAIKVLAGAPATRKAYRSSIRTDARAAARLSHPNVASVFDYGEYTTIEGETIPYVVMELLRGRSLTQRLKDGPLEPALALRMCAQVAGGLAAAHAAGMVHRDVKPGNVVLTPGGAKVIDFGIAASAGQLDEVRAGGPLLGTAAYLAPERLAGGAVTAASDVYALALLLYRALTNELPWPSETVTEMIAGHVYAEPAPLPDLPGVSAPVRDLVAQCLAKDPRDRPSARTAAIVLAEAAQIPAPLGEDPAPPPVPAPRPTTIRGPLVKLPHDPGDHDVAAVAVVAGADDHGDREATPPTESDGVEEATPPTEAREAAGSGRRRWLVAAGAAAVVLVAVAVALSLSGGREADGGAVAASQSSEGTGRVTGGPTPSRGSDGSGASTGGQAPSVDGTAATVGVTGVAETGPAASTAPADQTPSPVASTSTPAGTTFQTVGGAVTAVCQGNLALLTAWTPNPGYRVASVEAGPAQVTRVKFRSADPGVVNVKVTCDAGAPSVKVNGNND